MAESRAIFAGGCFWCMQPAFDPIEGVTKTVVGYTGGHLKDPSYEQVASGSSGHSEAIEVHYDASKVTYQELLAVFWHNIDPMVQNRQFCDVGPQYRSVIYTLSRDQEEDAKTSYEKIKQQLHAEIFTEILPASTFYPAEEYHQDYYKKNPIRYKFYRYSCGRDQRLEDIWGLKQEKG